MTQSTNSRSESAKPTATLDCRDTSTGNPGDLAATNRIKTYEVHVGAGMRPPAIEVEELVKIFEEAPGGKKGMAAARRWLGKAMIKEERPTLRALRLRAGLSQQHLADSVGLRQPNISAIEAGQRRPEYDTALKIAKVLKISVDELYAAISKHDSHA